MEVGWGPTTDRSHWNSRDVHEQSQGLAAFPEAAALSSFRAANVTMREIPDSRVLFLWTNGGHLVAVLLLTCLWNPLIPFRG